MRGEKAASGTLKCDDSATVANSLHQIRQNVHRRWTKVLRRYQSCDRNMAAFA
jgi:hypothetical protein